MPAESRSDDIESAYSKLGDAQGSMVLAFLDCPMSEKGNEFVRELTERWEMESELLTKPQDTMGTDAYHPSGQSFDAQRVMVLAKYLESLTEELARQANIRNEKGSQGWKDLTQNIKVWQRASEAFSKVTRNLLVPSDVTTLCKMTEGPLLSRLAFSLKGLIKHVGTALSELTIASSSGGDTDAEGRAKALDMSEITRTIANLSKTINTINKIVTPVSVHARNGSLSSIKVGSEGLLRIAQASDDDASKFYAMSTEDTLRRLEQLWAKDTEARAASANTGLVGWLFSSMS